MFHLHNSSSTNFSYCLVLPLAQSASGTTARKIMSRENYAAIAESEIIKFTYGEKKAFTTRLALMLFPSLFYLIHCYMPSKLIGR